MMELKYLFSGWHWAVVAGFALTWVAAFIAARYLWEASRRPQQPLDPRYKPKLQLSFDGFVASTSGLHRVRGGDITVTGTTLVSRVPLEEGSRVLLCIQSKRLSGWATVRYCVPGSRKAEFQVGVEFRGNLMRVDTGNWQYLTVPGTEPRVESAS